MNNYQKLNIESLFEIKYWSMGYCLNKLELTLSEDVCILL